MTGRSLRMRRLGREDLYLLVALDHGVSAGPVPGLADPTAVLRDVDAGGATGVILHKGLLKNVPASGARAGVLLHVSASTSRAQDPDDKRIVAGVQDALRWGTDGVSAHTNLGSLTEARQLEELGALTSEARAWDVPVLSMMYPRGPALKNPFDPGVVAHAARLAEELGADLVKTVYTGDAKSFRDVTSSVSIPVLVAGGPRADSERGFLEMVFGAMRGGAAGVSVGRNIFQHASPRRITSAVRAIVFEGASVRGALHVVKEVKA